MKNAEEMKKRMLCVQQKNNEESSKKAVEYCDTIIMEMIETEVEKGNAEVLVEIPHSISIEKCLEYLNNNGYKHYQYKTSKESYYTYMISWN